MSLESGCQLETARQLHAQNVIKNFDRRANIGGTAFGEVPFSFCFLHALRGAHVNSEQSRAIQTLMPILKFFNAFRHLFEGPLVRSTIIGLGFAILRPERLPQQPRRPSPYPCLQRWLQPPVARSIREHSRELHRSLPPPGHSSWTAETD